ncbi:Conserved hypothethical protein (fragment) [Cupriavidus taiwanensis]|uniref:Conserved hypothethical protein n=2 Tax=Cupriavidus taiwanensis TaxID=164546 RepID=A0A375J750_9BURK
MGGTRQKAWDYLAAIHAHYSAGGSLDELREFFPKVVSSWEVFAKYHVMFHGTPIAGTRKVPHLDLYDGDYWSAIRLTSLAILLRHSSLLPSIAALWDYENDDMDGLLERLVAPYLAHRGAPPGKCTRNLPYSKALKIFDAPADKRVTLMSSYLDAWYKGSRHEPYYESHTQGRIHNFLGYWSFEAAAISIILDIDDAEFRDKPFYPVDLADFGRRTN